MDFSLLLTDSASMTFHCLVLWEIKWTEAKLCEIYQYAFELRGKFEVYLIIESLVHQKL